MPPLPPLLALPPEPAALPAPPLPPEPPLAKLPPCAAPAVLNAPLAPPELSCGLPLAPAKFTAPAKLVVEPAVPEVDVPAEPGAPARCPALALPAIPPGAALSGVVAHE